MRRVFAAALILLILFALAGVGAYFFVRASIGSDLVRSAVERQFAAYIGQTVRIGAAGVSLYPRITLDLSDVSVGDPAAIHLDAVHLGVGLGGLWSRIVTDAELVAAGGRVTLPLPFPLVAASSSPTSAAAESALTIRSVRRIALRDFVLTGGQRTLRVDLESSFDGSRLEVHRLDSRAERSHVRAKGTVTDLARLEAAFTATADPLDLDELVALASAFTGPVSSTGRQEAAGAPMHIAVNLTATTGQFASYSFRDLSTTVDMTPTRFVLAPLTVSAFGGSFTGRLEADNRGREPSLRLSGQLDSLDVAELLTASGSPGGVTGKLSGTVALTGEGTETDRLIRSSRGTLAAAVANGTVPNLEMVRTIVLAFGKPSGAPPEGSGSVFSRLGGTFTLADGALRSTDLVMNARDFDMAGSGVMAIATGAADARADVVLSEELTRQAGTDLRRYAQEDGRVVVPARITGTLQQPAVTLDLAAAARRAVGNELKRRATSFLEGLFKKKD